MKQNDLSLKAEQGANDQALKQIDPSLEFGNSFPFFTDGGKSKIDFGGGLDKIDDSLATGSVESEAAGEMVTTNVTMDIETGIPLTDGPTDTAPYLSATPFWPTDLDKIKVIIDSLINDGMTDREKAQALHRWVRDNIKYGGEIPGAATGSGPC